MELDFFFGNQAIKSMQDSHRLFKVELIICKTLKFSLCIGAGTCGVVHN